MTHRSDPNQLVFESSIHLQLNIFRYHGGKKNERK